LGENFGKHCITLKKVAKELLPELASDIGKKRENPGKEKGGEGGN